MDFKNKAETAVCLYKDGELERAYSEILHGIRLLEAERHSTINGEKFICHACGNDKIVRVTDSPAVVEDVLFYLDLEINGNTVEDAAETEVYGGSAEYQCSQCRVIIDPEDYGSPMTDDEYVSKGGLYCPFCNARDSMVVCDSFEGDGLVVWQHSRCDVCGKVVTEYFKLIGYKESEHE